MPKVFVWELVDEETSTVQYVLAVAETAESALEKAGIDDKTKQPMVEIEVENIEQGKYLAGMMLGIIDRTMLEANAVRDAASPGGLDRFDNLL